MGTNRLGDGLAAARGTRRIPLRRVAAGTRIALLALLLAPGAQAAFDSGMGNTNSADKSLIGLIPFVPSPPPEGDDIDLPDGMLLPEAAVSRRVALLANSAQRYAEEGDWERAAKDLEMALTLQPENPRLQLLASHVYAMGGRHDRAEALLEKLVARQPNDPGLLARWGGMLLRVRKPEAAEETLRQALTEAPKHLVARYNLACTLIGLGQAEAAAQYLRATSSYEAGSFLQWTAGEAEVLSHVLGDEGYRSLCRYVLSGGAPPSVPDASVGQLVLSAGGTASVPVQEPPVAMEPMLAQELKNLAPELATLARHLWNGHSAMLDEQWRSALDALTRAVAGGVQTPAVARDIAVCLFKTDEPEAAYALLEKLMERDPQNPNLQSAYGFFHLEDGRYPRAEALFRTAHEADPTNLQTTLGLACAYAAQGKADPALPLLREVAERDKRAWPRWYERAKPYLAKLNPDPRYQAWQASLWETGPENEPIQSD